MSLFVLDTDHVPLWQMGHPYVLQNIVQHLNDDLAIAVITDLVPKPHSPECGFSPWTRVLANAATL